MRARAHASAVGQASDGVRTLDLPRPAASQLTKFCSLHLHLYKNTRLEAPLIPSGSLACVAYNTIREVENARSKFRQETFETLAKFNVTKFRVVFVLLFFANRCKPLCSVNVYASDRCRWKKPYRKKKSFVWTPMHRFRTLTKPAYSAARPLQHLFSTFFGQGTLPRALFVLASEKCEAPISTPIH